MVTLKQVAELAQVSEATASLALNGGPVKESTRKRVLVCATRLKYVPNRIGRILTTGRTNTIAMLIMTSARHADTVHETALFYYLVEGVLSVVDQKNFSLRLDVKSHEDPALSTYFERVVKDRSLDGIIIVPQFLRDYDFLSILRQGSFPYVMLRPARFGDSINYVDMDNFGGGRAVANLFRSLGVNKVALINGPQTHVDAIERERGFMDGLASAGLSKFEKRYGDFTIPSGFKAMGEIFDKFAPEAVFCANDYMAAGAMKYLHEKKINIPGDVAIVGYDNNDICLGLFPALTSVDNRFEELGQCLARELLALIEDKSTTINRVIKPALAKRQSHLWTSKKCSKK
jgi:DNA-binding LacI/PurR family transcriptional regulator